jgi:hypothetical protein
MMGKNNNNENSIKIPVVEEEMCLSMCVLHLVNAQIDFTAKIYTHLYGTAIS